jgi:hypothetical protein
MPPYVATGNRIEEKRPPGKKKGDGKGAPVPSEQGFYTVSAKNGFAACVIIPMTSSALLCGVFMKKYFLID